MKHLQLVLLIFLSNILLCLTTVVAQEQPSLQKRADLLFDQLEYFNAAKIYEKLVTSKKIKTKNLERLAESYFRIKDYDLAENWYARVVQTKDYTKESLLNYASVLQQNAKYTEAKEVYNKYLEAYGDDNFAKLGIVGADSAVKWIASPKKIEISSFPKVNTSVSEFGLFPFENNYLYASESANLQNATSGMTGQPYLKIFSVSKNNSEEKPVLLNQEFNKSPYHVGPVSSNKSGSKLFVTRTNPNSNVQKFSRDGYKWRRANLELIEYTNNNGVWEERNFQYNNVKSYSLGHAVLSDDEKRLYFVSDMPGGVGGSDIWYSDLQQDGTWTSPTNAGLEINTPFEEMFPMVYKNTIFYSSDGKPGLGGLDIFESKITGNTFSKPINVGFPLNSASDDFALYKEMENQESSKGAFSSNRKGSTGGDDIYQFNFIKPVYKILLKGKTYDKKTKALLTSTSVSLLGDHRAMIGKKVSDQQASFEFDLAPKKSYKVIAEKQGYHADSTSFNVAIPQRDTTIEVALYLEPIFEKGNKFVLEDIYYDFDEYNIRPDAAVILDQLVRTLRDNPTLKIELSSHTDSRGSNRYNDTLSQNRANKAVEYIISRGIAANRLVAKGYGESRLINRCADGVKCSAAEHQANRRTEIEVLSY